MAAVIGAGAIGGYIAAMLHGAGHDVTLCVRTPFDRLVVEIDGKERDVPVTMVDDPATVTPHRFVFLTTKAQDTESAAPWLERLCDVDTTVVVAQNGIGHEERLRPLVGEASIVPAIVYIAAERTEPGRVLHRGASRFIVPRGKPAAGLSAYLAGSDLAVEETDAFHTIAWRKLLANIGVNPITTLTLRRIDVFEEQPVREMTRALLREAVVVANADGAVLGEADIDETLALYDGIDRASGSSMLYDRLSGRSLEHEHLTGAVLRAAERHGLDAPLNRMIYVLLDALDRSRERAG